MGWTFYERKSLNDIVEDRLATYTTIKGETAKAIKSSLKNENGLYVLWIVRECSDRRWIECILIERDHGQWGHKDMDESVHPYYYSCPIEYLELVPCACEAWRNIVNTKGRKG